MTGFEIFLLQLVVSVAIAIITYKPLPPGRRYELSDFDIPTATEDRAQSIGFGTFKIAGNVIYYGDYAAEERSRKIKSMFGLMSTKLSLGYEYSLTLWQTLCGVTCDEVLEIRLGDHTIWSGTLALSKTAATVLEVNTRYYAAEGQEVMEGMDGIFTFFNYSTAEEVSDNNFNPPANPKMQTLLGRSVIPAYPNTLHVVYTGFISTSPRIEPLTFVLKRRPNVSAALQRGISITYPVAGTINQLETSDPVYNAVTSLIASAGDILGDANPALVELELLTTRVPGIGSKLSPWGVDLSSYLRAAQLYKDEAHGVSFAWEVSRPMADIVKDLMMSTYSTRETDERTGRIRTRAVRDTDLPAITFDASNILEVSTFKRSDPTTAPNVITVPFVDRSAGWPERLALAKNPAGVRAAGKQIDVRSEFIGVSRGALASQLAHREARRFASPLATVTFVGVIPPGQVLKPMELIIFKHPTLNQTLRMRVAAVRFATYGGKARAEIEAVEDVFRSGYIGNFTVLPPPVEVVKTTPTSLASPQVLLAPYALTGTDVDHALYFGIDTGLSVNSYNAGYQLRPTWDDAIEPIFAEGLREPAITATLNSALASTYASPFLAFTLSAGALQQWNRETRQQVYLLAGTEWMSCSSWLLSGNTLTAQYVIRGVFDSAPVALAAGSTVSILLGFTLIPEQVRTTPPSGSAQYAGTEAVVIRAESRGGGGVLEVNSAAASQATMLYFNGSFRAVRPLSPCNVRLNGNLGVLTDTETGPTLTRASSYSLTFANRNRLTRGIADWFGTGGEAEPGTVVRAILQHENAGIWNNLSDVTGTAGATSLTLSFSASSLPTGPRRLRVRVQSDRAAPTGVISSNVTYHYFYVTT